MYGAFKNIDKVLKNRGQIMIVIGDNVTKAGGQKVNIETTECLKEMGLTLKWNLRELINITVTGDSMKHAKNRIRENVVLWFEKP